MKKNFIFILLFALSLSHLYSQEKNYFSIQADNSYQYYFFNNNDENLYKLDFKNKFNYGFSLIGSKYFNKFKISTGIKYISKTCNNNVEEPLSETLSRDFKIKYINLPIIGSYEIFSRNTFNTDIDLGLILNRIVDYRLKTYYINNNVSIGDNIYAGQQLGLSIIGGFTFTKLIGQKFALNIQPFICYKLINDHDIKYSMYIGSKLPDDKLSLGIKIGLEFLFKKSE